MRSGSRRCAPRPCKSTLLVVLCLWAWLWTVLGQAPWSERDHGQDQHANAKKQHTHCCCYWGRGPRLWEKGVGVSRGLMPATTWVAERIESTFRNSRPPSVQTPSTVLLAFGATWEAQSSGRQGQRERGLGKASRSEPEGGARRTPTEGIAC